MAKKEEKKDIKTITGIVSGLSSAKTIRVRVETKYPHPKYGKIVKFHKNFLVHNDTDIELEVGNEVEIKEIRPVSRRKSWTLVKKTK